MTKLDQIYPDDTFIVSYPKSGTTWIRFIISNYLTDGKSVSFATNELLPDIHAHADICNSLNRPRIMKSHLPFQSNYRNVVYIVRDARDVAVSFYFHSRKYNLNKNNETFESFLDKFNAGKLNFGSWSNHVSSWLDNAPSNFLMVKYEDVKRDTYTEMVKILMFLNIDIVKLKLEKAIMNSSFEKMSQMEQELIKSEPLLYNSNTDINFIRKGIVGDYKNYFKKSSEGDFMAVHYQVMHRLGYVN